MKVKLLGEDPARLEALREAVLALDDSLEVTGSIGNPDSLTPLLNGSLPDAVVLEGTSARGLEAIGALALRQPGLHTIVISRDPSPEFLLQAMRAGVREVVPLESPPQVLHAALMRVKQLRAAASGNEGKVFAFLACKGGCGATFLASNLAYTIAAETSKRVALIDLNLQFGDAALYVSDQPAPSNLGEVAQQIRRLDASLLKSSMLEVLPNFLVLAAPPDPAHAADVRAEHVDAIVKLARRHFDLIVLDAPRTLDGVSLRALDGADTIFAVAQLLLPVFRDAKRLADVFRSLEYPRKKVQFIVNRYEKGGSIPIEDLEKAVGQKVFKTVPNSYRAVEASVNLGVPIVKAQRKNPVSKVLIETAHELMPVEQKSAGGLLSRLFGARS
jgi:pilus assembly protein CpaE